MEDAVCQWNYLSMSLLTKVVQSWFLLGMMMMMMLFYIGCVVALAVSTRVTFQ
jgi:hypothetical protein